MPKYQVVKKKMRDGKVLAEEINRLGECDLDYARHMQVLWSMTSMNHESEAMARDNYGLSFQVEEVTAV